MGLGRVATALLEQRGSEALLEVDEAWLPQVAAELEPTLLILGNLFRDQLDRYGELERLADEWAELIAASPASMGLVLNADDPLVADLGRDEELQTRPGTTYFGIEDTARALPELQHAFDAKHCRRCGSPYRYERAFVGHLGHYTCPNCGADRPTPDVRATAIELRGIEGTTFRAETPAGDLQVEIPLGLYNVYNALTAIAAGLRLGVGLEQIGVGLRSVRAVFGRVETIPVDGTDVSILLVKNPAGANEVLRTLALEAERSQQPLELWMALNDRIADGRDVSGSGTRTSSLAGGGGHVTCSGTRVRDGAAAQVRGLPD